LLIDFGYGGLNMIFGLVDQDGRFL